MTLLSQIIQYAISGITSGSIYAVIGICWSVVYWITKVLNFTTGEFLMLGRYVHLGVSWRRTGDIARFAPGCGWNSLRCHPYGEDCDPSRPAPFRDDLHDAHDCCSVRNQGIVLLIWGSETRIIDPFFGTEAIHLFGATLTPQVLCVLALLVTATVGLSLFLNRTLFGKALRASSINLTGASLMGIDIIAGSGSSASVLQGVSVQSQASLLPPSPLRATGSECLLA